MDRHELFAAMAHFHHAHATASPIEHFVGGLTQNLFGHGRGTGGEIEDTHREILKAGAKNEDRAKIGEINSRPAMAVQLTRQSCRRDFLARVSDRVSHRKRKWPSARVRKRPLSHCHRQAAKPGMPSAYEAALPIGGWRDINAALGLELTWPA
ncbi:hypothetical protein [Paraburkholderia aromaticivorans]|uniref:hypothetical protein n=1 Tax=Paraburkholderia aromaticivorans TaxID=2026199 RepID=UPI001FC990FD|nr:hypothetical protein [Paraburkholderia aromaticivorans]